MIWDEEVDVVCTGSGIAGLAHAVAVVDMGGEVFVANSRGDVEPSGSSVAVRSHVDRLHWLEVDVPDPETNEYFAALSSDLGPLTRSARDVDVPIRVVDHAEPVDPRGAVAPFVGARLQGLGRALPGVAVRLSLHPAYLIGSRPRCAPSTASRLRSLKSDRSHPIPPISVARSWTGSPLRPETGVLRFITPPRCSASCSRTAMRWGPSSRHSMARWPFVPDTV